MRRAAMWTLALIGLAASFEAATAQRLMDAPVRVTAHPDALVTGPAAIFWNPAGLGTGAYRTEVLVLNVRTPDVIGLAGFGGALAGKFERTTLAVGYEHVGIDDITETLNSPTDATGELSLGEDHFSIAAGRRVTRRVSVGAVARYARDNLGDTDPLLGLGAGVEFDAGGRFMPRFGAYAISEKDIASWGAGVEARLPDFAGPDYRFGVSYGLGGRTDTFTAHRVLGFVDWGGTATLAAGMLSEPDASASNWQPVMAAGLRFRRYGIGVVRESLANDFGATYSFRLQVGFGK